MKPITGLLLVLLISCNNSNKATEQIMDFGLFTLEAPEEWKRIKEKGTDSYVGKIAIDNSDTLEFDLGWYSNTLTEPEPMIIERSTLPLRSTKDFSEYIIVDDIRNIDPDQYRKNNVSWDTIDGRKAKIVFPRKQGIGMTGIYIDSLWVSGSSVDKFNLVGFNLKPVNQELVRQAIKTLKFHKKK